MSEFLCESTYFGVLVSLCAYGLGTWCKKKTGFGWCNPLLISIIVTILVLLGCGIDYETYQAGAKYLSYLLTPATVCLAIPLYEQFEQLKQNNIAILVGILAGVMTSLVTILALAVILGFDHQEYVTFLPKSITTAIGMDISEELGGIVPITVTVIILTGVLGNVLADGLFRLFRIKEPIARGVALGTSSHAIGTAKAMELGEVEGAMSSLSIVVAGILTVCGASVFANLI